MRGLWVAALCLAWAAEANAQRIIYDGQRDTTAQQAAAAAKEVTAGSLFDTMLRNVDAQARLEVDVVTAFVQERMKAKLNAFEVWSEPATVCPRSIKCVLTRLAEQHQDALKQPALTPADLKTRLEDIRKKTAELQEQLKKLSAAKQNDPLVIRAFALIEDPGEDILGYAQKIADFAANQTELAKGVPKALDAIESGLDQVLVLYKALAGIWQGQQAVKVDPSSLRPPSQQIDLQLLAVEKAHLTTRARIDARKHLEIGVALAGVQEALASLETVKLGSSTETIEGSLRAAANAHDRTRLFDLLAVLHEAAAAIAQLDAAESLADLRHSDEARRYSIRTSAINTTTYDLTIQAAVQRLTLYWRSGLKSAEIAQFAFYIVNTFALPAIALK